jgi:hypothetical protein
MMEELLDTEVFLGRCPIWVTTLRCQLIFNRLFKPKGGHMLLRSILTSLAIALSSVISFAADFGDLAGTYSGKTAKGGDIVIVVPPSGTPTYRFRGSPVMVSSAKLSGKTITMNVGPNGFGKVSLVTDGKGASYSYRAGQDTASASLIKK